MGKLTKSDLIDVAEGAGFMGSGGGGPLTTGLALVGNMPGDTHVEVVGVSGVAPEKLAAVSADMGSPNAMLRVKEPSSLVAAFDGLADYERRTGAGEVAYTIPVEVGGENTIAALAVAAALDLAVADGDGTGRAVPSLTQTTFFGHGVSPFPSILADSRGHAIAILAHTTPEVEALARPILQAGFHEQAGLAMWAMDAQTLAGAIPIRGNIEIARQVGARLRTSCSPVRDVCELFRDQGRGGCLLCTGVPQEPDESTRGGFDVGRASIELAGGSTVTVYNQNEDLIAWSDRSSSPLAMAPDSICYLTTDGEPFSNADIEPMDLVGREVALIGLIAAAALRDDRRIMASFRKALVTLGSSGSYLPIEDLAG